MWVHESPVSQNPAERDGERERLSMGGRACRGKDSGKDTEKECG